MSTPLRIGTLLACRFGGRLARIAVVLALVVVGLGLPQQRLGALMDGTIYDPWPPYLDRGGVEPGDELAPIEPRVMVQVATAALTMLQGSIGHVDAYIVEAAEAPKFSASDLIYFIAPRKPYEQYGTNLVSDLLGEAGDLDNGVGSLALVRAEMASQGERLREIIARYQDPGAVPGEGAGRDAFLARQTTEAEAIHTAVDWAIRGREYVVGWVLGSLFQPDELLAYQGRILQLLEPQYQELSERDFGLESWETDRYLQMLGEAEEAMEAPYAAEEERLIEEHVARYRRLAEQTQAMVEKMGDQIVEFVGATPPEWGEVPFAHYLYNPIRYRSDRLFPYDSDSTWDFLELRTEFWSPYEGIDDQDGYMAWRVGDYVWEILADNPGVVLVGDVLDCRLYLVGCAQPLYLYDPWEEGRDLALPKEPTEPLAPEYPEYVLVNPPTVPQVLLWGAAVPGAPTADWSYLIPEDVIAQHELDGNWIVMGVYGQSLFAVESRLPDLSWAPADSHLEYRLLHTGTYNAEKANGHEDTGWRGFWEGLRHHSSFRGKDETSRLPVDDADFYIVAVRLAPHTWAGRYQFKIGDLEILWALPHARNQASTRFARRLREAGEAVDYDDLFEPTHDIFKHDRFFVEIETTEDVVTDDRIPFMLVVSREGGPPEAVLFKTTAKEDSQTLYAHRAGDNRRLFRSEQIFVQAPGGANAWREDGNTREVGVALAPGDRLAARVAPHGVASQAGMGVVAVHTAPAEVGAAWREAVVKAASLIGKAPAKPWGQLTTDEFNAMLRLPWGSVNSAPFVRVGGREIDLTLGDLAAMLLIRDEFNREMGEALPQVRALKNRLNGGRNALGVLREDIRPDASREGTPLGEIRVSDPSGPPLATVPFRLVYDEEWVRLAFRDRINGAAAKPEWLDEVTVAAVTEYYQAAVSTYRYSMGREITGYHPDLSLDLADPEEMLRLTAVGMGRIADRLKPNLLRLVEDPSAPRWDAFRWEADITARGYVGTIQALGAELHANEALMDQYNAMTMVVAGGAGLLPQGLLAQGAALLVGAGTLAATLTAELPDYLSRKEDVEFALGAYRAIGEERYITAALREKPGWAIVLDLAGGAADVLGSLAQLRHTRSAWAAAAADEEVAALLAEGVPEFLAAPKEAQQSALVRIAQLSEMRQAGKTLTELEETVLLQGSQMLDEAATFGDIVPPRYLDPAALEGTETLFMADGRIAYASPRGDPLLPGGATLAPPATPTVPMRLPEQTPWHIFDVQDRLGYGAYAQVYEVAGAGDVTRALKVYERGQNGIDDVQRALRAESLLEGAGIPQLRIIDHGVHDGMAYLVQEIMPAPGIYKPVKGVPMEEEMAKALLGLYRKLGQKNIGWADGWWANVYFFHEVEGGPMVAGVLDQDRVWEIGKGINSGVWGGNSNELMGAILGAPGFRRFGMRSIARSEFTPAALALLERGFSPWPDADFFMMKMLEHRGWIRYDREAGKFVSDRMSIDLVREYFPRLDDLESIDPLFDVPPHLRPNGPDLPLGDLPSDLGGANTAPDEKLALAA